MHGHHEADGGVLVQVLVVNASFFAVELAGGLAAGSLALVADAGHMLADAGALALALVAAWFAAQPATPTKSYGFYRAEILAALANGLGLGAIALYVLVEAARRARHPRAVDGGLLLVIALGGLAVNAWSAWRLRHGHGINLRAARMHMLADAAGSVGAVLAGVLVLAGVQQADAVVGAVLAVLIAAAAWRLLREAVDILLEATPAHISLLDVRDAIAAHPGVESVHDLHVWTLTSGYVALSCHVVASSDRDAQALLPPLRALVADRFGIEHATLQVETPELAGTNGSCGDDPRCLP